MVVQAYLFLVKKLEPALEPAEEIKITSVASASPVAPVPEFYAQDPPTTSKGQWDIFGIFRVEYVI